ncbi:MAG: InlB B-repeat-containing protein, partial [Oscillospiraceae bacterium]
MKSSIRKRLMPVLLTLALVLSLMPALTLPAKAASGNWTDENNYAEAYAAEDASAKTITISSEAQLARLAYMVNSGTAYSDYTVTLTDDIDLGDHYWVPIGSDYSNGFKGSFDGGGHTVSNMCINGAYSYAGLFGFIDGIGSSSGIFVKDISVKGTVDMTATQSIEAGGVAGFSRDVGSFENCSSDVDITASVSGTYEHAWVGGICGETYNSSDGISLTGCSSSGTLSAAQTGPKGSVWAGGLIGRCAGASVVNCASTSAVSAASTGYPAYAGGLFGEAASACIYNSYASGEVSGTASGDTCYAGGMFGYISYSVETDNCYSSGSVSGSGTAAYVGGFAGCAEYNLTATNSYWLGSTTDSAFGIGTAPDGLMSLTESQLKNTAALGGDGDYSAMTVLSALNKEAAGINGAEAWIAVDGVNNGYPGFSTYTVTFSSDGSSYTLGGSNGGAVTAPDDPEAQEGYTFGGWFKDSSYVTQYDFSGNVTDDLTLYAKWTEKPSADLKGSSTIKGRTVTDLGTPGETLGSETVGSATITLVQAADTTNTGEYITLFDKKDVNAALKAVKYASGADTSGFETDTAYANQAITDGDFFIVKVTLADQTSVNYYKIVVTVVESIPADPHGNWTDENNYAEAYAAEDASAKTITISSAAQLARLAYMVNSGTAYSDYTVTLTNDIDLGDHYWVPIGSDYSNGFKGSFDGGGHTVSNMCINGAYSYAGLFGFIDGIGSSSGIFVKDISVKGTVDM